jgi:hypothetical protein
MKPPWLKLNEQWQAERNFGLTIPFLLGALQQWPGQPLGTGSISVKQMRALLASIRDDTPDGIFMRLYMCDTRHELILAPIPSYLPAHCIAIPSTTRSKPALFVEKGIVPDDANLFEALVGELWRRYREVIQAGFFSLYDGAFRPLNDDERRLICAAINRPDDDA